MKVRWLLAHYGFSSKHSHIAVPANARGKLMQMVGKMSGTDDLVGIYVPEGADDVYEAGAMKGRIVGAVRLLPMPPGKRPEDYFYHDILQTPNETPRWPFGWPCAVVLNINPESITTLRTLVCMAHPRTSFGAYAVQFQQGPLELGFEMSMNVNNELIDLFGEPPWKCSGTGS